MAALEMVLITGMSGSGKSVALHALEDAGYYCVDNLPPELLTPFVALEQQHGAPKVAIAMDVRSATSLPLVPQQLKQLRESGVAVQSLFLDANTETLVRRFSETRRLHPLSRIDASDQHRALVDAIELERELLGEMREQAHVLDTSMIRSSQLQGYVKSLISAPSTQLTLVFESFAFKRGVPLDADYVFDVRMLPNPHYESGLRHLTGSMSPWQLPQGACGGRRHVQPHRAVSQPLASGTGARSPQLRDGRHRLHRRTTPLGLSGRGTGSHIRPLSGAR
jgi:UPF0042 nucleotide-binding protein